MTHQPPPGQPAPRPSQPPSGPPQPGAGAPPPPPAGSPPRAVPGSYPPPNPPPAGRPPAGPPYGAPGFGAPGFGAPGYGPPGFGTSPGYGTPGPGGPYGPPPPPGPPRRNTNGILIAVGAGVVALLAVAALVVVLGIRAGSSSDDGQNPTVAAPSTTELPGVPTTPGDTGTSADQADVTAIRTSMQTFLDALNSRDLTRIKASVCSELRPKVNKPPSGEGNVVLDGLTSVSVTGDSAESTVLTHVEVGAKRSVTEQNEERFVRESGTWYVCPGSEPDIGT
ncbi:Rv0361 family membrane protein [Gordonia soli]|uniref:DUF4878 domain-containing protein n=1 Tax=Gordonia soli NBRC 108243 TaxID=1223545 RepID=M0QDR7_9ACTN|nr:hypothetical protein [Gordonia soli]GAC66743.1 hypothetical protein GS4_03_01930 [Gordonia soli NBRC 108243]